MRRPSYNRFLGASESENLWSIIEELLLQKKSPHELWKDETSCQGKPPVKFVNKEATYPSDIAAREEESSQAGKVLQLRGMWTSRTRLSRQGERDKLFRWQQAREYIQELRRRRRAQDPRRHRDLSQLTSLQNWERAGVTQKHSREAYQWLQCSTAGRGSGKTYGERFHGAQLKQLY